jgi:molecular chaperone DnaJ
MAREDYYKILGVDRDADEEEIKRAYRRVAKECHPDVTQGDEEAAERFRRATEAYEVLRDPQKRAAYDRELYGAGIPSPAGKPWDFMDLADELIWNMLREIRGFPAWDNFGGELEIELTPREAQTGIRVSFDVPIARPCGICEGSGYSWFGEICPRCRGTGRVEGSRRVAIDIPPGVRQGDRLRITVPTGTRILEILARIRVAG